MSISKPILYAGIYKNSLHTVFLWGGVSQLHMNALKPVTTCTMGHENNSVWVGCKVHILDQTKHIMVLNGRRHGFTQEHTQ